MRYITPLREGGSLPAIAEADDDFMYVIKFRGAGQGVKALVAELIGGEIARVLGLKMPEIVFAQLDEAFGRTEPDEEIQDLLKSSTGLNVGVHYLSGSFMYDPVVYDVDAMTASMIVWMDALLMNVDRTPKNTNLLVWNKELWLIDHGASLYFHHSGTEWNEQAERPFQLIKDHVLLSRASALEEADNTCKKILSENVIDEILSLVPSDWLASYDPEKSSDKIRNEYRNFLLKRISSSHIFVKEAQHARQSLI
jgi:hypothetical protein